MKSKDFKRDPNNGSLQSINNTEYNNRKNTKQLQNDFEKHFSKLEKKIDNQNKLILQLINMVHNSGQ